MDWQDFFVLLGLCALMYVIGEIILPWIFDQDDDSTEFIDYDVIEGSHVMDYMVIGYEARDEYVQSTDVSMKYVTWYFIRLADGERGYVGLYGNGRLCRTFQPETPELSLYEDDIDEDYCQDPWSWYGLM